MYGNDVGTLNVYVIPDGGNFDDFAPVWTFERNQDNLWYIARAHVTHTSAYNVVFEVVLANGDNGDIAIDDVRITNGACLTQGKY